MAASLSDCGKVLSLVYAALLTASVRAGLGKHAYALELPAFARALRLYTIAIPFGTLSVALPTISLAIILNDITTPTAKQRWLLFGVPSFNALIKVVDLRAIQDFTFGYTRWVVIEANVLIITTCVPGLRPFVKYIRTKCDRNPSLLEVAKDPHPSHDTSDLPSPTSARRMEPRSSGSVSHSLQLPTPRLNKEMTLERIVSKTEDVEKQAPDEWPGTEEVKWKSEETATPGRDCSKDQMRGNDRRENRRISAPIRVAEKELGEARPLSR
ncbi:MAG: hypothetical protein Q9208_006737 [Pyrenodesmia sp. 3 TL-2023]